MGRIRGRFTESMLLRDDTVLPALSPRAQRGTMTNERIGLAGSGSVELRKDAEIADARVGALVTAVNAARVAGFPSGRLFLDSVEQALAVARVERYGIGRPSPVIYRGGLGSAGLRKVIELVDSKTDSDLTLEDVAGTVKLSVAHFSQLFRKSTRARCATPPRPGTLRRSRPGLPSASEDRARHACVESPANGQQRRGRQGHVADITHARGIVRIHI